MATKILINFEDDNSWPGNGIVYSADFLPNVGEFISLKGKSGIVRERKFSFGLQDESGILNGVLLNVRAATHYAGRTWEPAAGVQDSW